MNRNIFLRRISVLVLLSLFCALPVCGMAYDWIDMSRPVKLTIRAEQDGIGLEGVEFDIYQVATVTKTAEYQLTPEFRASGMEISGMMDAADWEEAMEAFVACTYSATPVITPTTDADGVITLPSGDPYNPMPGLAKGLYLIIGRRTEVGNYVYSFSPALVTLPTGSSDLWNYSVSVDMKKTREQTRIDLDVVKIWQDKGHRDTRAASIVVDLLRDGVIDRTVRLSSYNNWRCTFTGLDNRYTWTVRERSVPEGYRVKYEQDGTKHFIYNTLVKPTSGGKLPQTGQLWWPVPLLACAGMLLFIIGYVKNRRKGRQDEEE